MRKESLCWVAVGTSALIGVLCVLGWTGRPAAKAKAHRPDPVFILEGKGYEVFHGTKACKSLRRTPPRRIKEVSFYDAVAGMKRRPCKYCLEQLASEWTGMEVTDWGDPPGFDYDKDVAPYVDKDDQ